MPLLFRGAVSPVLNWLVSLPQEVLDDRPGLWVMYASALIFVSQLAGVEQKLQAAEAALQGGALDARTRDLIGHIAAIRATVAVTQHDVDTIVFQSRRALEYLNPNNLPVRTATTWTLGYAYLLRGDRAAAGRAYTEAIAYQPVHRPLHHSPHGHHGSGPCSRARHPAGDGGRDLSGRRCNSPAIDRCR